MTSFGKTTRCDKCKYWVWAHFCHIFIDVTATGLAGYIVGGSLWFQHLLAYFFCYIVTLFNYFISLRVNGKEMLKVCKVRTFIQFIWIWMAVANTFLVAVRISENPYLCVVTGKVSHDYNTILTLNEFLWQFVVSLTCSIFFYCRPNLKNIQNMFFITTYLCD